MLECYQGMKTGMCHWTLQAGMMEHRHPSAGMIEHRHLQARIIAYRCHRHGCQTVMEPRRSHVDMKHRHSQVDMEHR